MDDDRREREATAVASLALDVPPHTGRDRQKPKRPQSSYGSGSGGDLDDDGRLDDGTRPPLAVAFRSPYPSTGVGIGTK